MKIGLIQRNPNANQRGWVCDTSWGHLCSGGKMRIMSNNVKTCDVCGQRWGPVQGWWTSLMAHQRFEQGCAFVGNSIHAAKIGIDNWLRRGRLKRPTPKGPKG